MYMYVYIYVCVYMCVCNRTQCSAYITHKILAVRKIMEALRTAYAKIGTRSQQSRLKLTHDANDNGRHASDGKARIVCEEHVCR